MKGRGILIILLVFGLVLLAAVALALVPNLLTPSAPAPEIPEAGVPTPTLAASLPTAAAATVPADGSLPIVGDGSGQGAFNGQFAGSLSSDDGSVAPVSLNLSQTGTTVSGDITIGDGLTIDGGNCGAQAVPAGSRSVTGEVDPSNPNHIEVSAGYDVQGFTVTAELIADLSADGRTLTGQIGLDLPLICGRDPSIAGMLERQ